MLDCRSEADRTSIMIVTLLVVGIVIMCTVWYVRHKRWRRRVQSLTVTHSTGLEVLATRYARGEINREEYLQKRDDILANHVVSECHN
jgi:uncharacterized membrane protein